MADGTIGLVVVVIVVVAAVAIWRLYLRHYSSGGSCLQREDGFPLTRRAFYCCAALCKHERGPKAGIPLRRDHRGNHHCPFQGTQACL